MHFYTIAVAGILCFINTAHQTHVVHTFKAPWGDLFKEAKFSDRPLFCYMQPILGKCKGNDPRFYFDINFLECRKFVYGGCGGNRNKFRTKGECTRKCEALVPLRSNNATL